MDLWILLEVQANELGVCLYICKYIIQNLSFKISHENWNFSPMEIWLNLHLVQITREIPEVIPLATLTEYLTSKLNEIDP